MSVLPAVAAAHATDAPGATTANCGELCCAVFTGDVISPPVMPITVFDGGAPVYPVHILFDSVTAMAAVSTMAPSVAIMVTI